MHYKFLIVLQHRVWVCPIALKHNGSTGWHQGLGREGLRVQFPSLWFKKECVCERERARFLTKENDKEMRAYAFELHVMCY